MTTPVDKKDVIQLLRNRDEWLRGMHNGGYFLGENDGLYPEPESYPCYEYAPRQNDWPAYLYSSDLEEMLQELRP